MQKIQSLVHLSALSLGERLALFILVFVGIVAIIIGHTHQAFSEEDTVDISGLSFENGETLEVPIENGLVMTEKIVEPETAVPMVDSETLVLIPPVLNEVAPESSTSEVGGVADSQLVLISPTPTVVSKSEPTPTKAVAAAVTVAPTAIPTVTSSPTSTPVVVAVDPNSEDIWNKIAECESHQNWSIDTGNGYFGGLQFSQGAWNSVGGSGNPAHASREEQIMRGKMLQQMRGWGPWGACSKKLGLN